LIYYELISIIIGFCGVCGFPRLVILLILLAKAHSLDIHVPKDLALEGKGSNLLDELAPNSNFEDLKQSLPAREGRRQEYSRCDLRSSELNGRVGRN
jgi:hypothetical protein